MRREWEWFQGRSSGCDSFEHSGGCMRGSGVVGGCVGRFDVHGRESQEARNNGTVGLQPKAVGQESRCEG